MWRRRLKRSALAAAVVYAALWAATAVWGPAAAERWDREGQLARYGSMAEQHGRRLRGFTVPAPFVVAAEWEHGGPRGSRVDYSEGDLWGCWLPGCFWAVNDRMKLVACG